MARRSKEGTQKPVGPSTADIVFTLNGPGGNALVTGATTKGADHLRRNLNNFTAPTSLMEPKYIEIVAISAQVFGLRTRIDNLAPVQNDDEDPYNR
jgi:hypothetical protein